MRESKSAQLFSNHTQQKGSVPLRSEKANNDCKAAPNSDITNIGDLILSVSQELASPLNRVCQHVDQVTDLLGSLRDGQIDVHLQGIIDQVYRISSVAHNLIALSKHSLPTFVDVNINEIILDAIENCEQERGTQVALSLYLDDAIPTVIADPLLLTSVFHHLILASDELAGEDGVPQIKTSISPADGCVKVEIRTRGPQVQLDHTEKIFELFQGNEKLSPGCILGLYISERLLEAQHCTLRIATSEQVGNVLEVGLPSSSGLSTPFAIFDDHEIQVEIGETAAALKYEKNRRK